MDGSTTPTRLMYAVRECGNMIIREESNSEICPFNGCHSFTGSILLFTSLHCTRAILFLGLRESFFFICHDLLSLSFLEFLPTLFSVVVFFFQIEVIVLGHEYFIPVLVITPVLIGHPIDILLFLRRRTLVAVLATKKKVRVSK